MSNHPAMATLKILSWNTLCYEDPWFVGWGCPLELERRDALMELNGGELSVQDAQQLLTRERYQRIRSAVWEEMRMMVVPTNSPLDGDVTNSTSSSNNNTTLSDSVVDIFLFQELTQDDPWDEDDDFSRKVSSLYDRVSCQDDNEGNLQRVYVRIDSGWKAIHSFSLDTDALEGGCLVEFEYVGTKNNNNSYDNETFTLLCGEEEEDIDDEDCHVDMHNRLFLVNLHGKSGAMRNSEKRKVGMDSLWKRIADNLPGRNDAVAENGKVSWDQRIVMCGDWNTQLTDLLDAFPKWGASPPIPALLDNETTANFSTNHEAGFLAQYDGCILASSSVLRLDGVTRNLTGFMAKGPNGKLTGDFSYVQSEGLFYAGTLLPGTLASDGLSDHLRIYTSLSIYVGDNATGLGL